MKTRTRISRFLQYGGIAGALSGITPADAATVCPGTPSGGSPNPTVANYGAGNALCYLGPNFANGVSYGYGRFFATPGGGTSIRVVAYMYSSTPFPGYPTHLSVKTHIVDSATGLPKVDQSGNRTCFVLDTTKNGSEAFLDYPGNTCLGYFEAWVTAHSNTTGT
jgi:hypothetical protein